MNFKQSLCIGCFLGEGVDLDNLCAAAAAAGYHAVETWWADDHFADLVATARRHGLTIASFCGHGTLQSGLNDAREHDRIESELRRSLTLASEHGVPNLICFSGNRIPGQSEDQAIETCARGLRRVTPLAEKLGISINMELLNSKVDHAGYQCDHTHWGVRMCQAADSPSVKLLYDIYHMQIMEGDVIRTIQQNIQWIGHFHTAGNPGRHDLDDSQELFYPAICRAIAQCGYSRFLAHEFTPKADRLQALRQAFGVCHVTL